MESELISIIVPIYNVGACLQKSIQSIVKQSYKNLEIIRIDDGSTDGSSEISDMWAAIDGSIHVIHKENGGLSDARNVGIAASSGSFCVS